LPRSAPTPSKSDIDAPFVASIWGIMMHELLDSFDRKEHAVESWSPRVLPLEAAVLKSGHDQQTSAEYGTHRLLCSPHRRRPCSRDLSLICRRRLPRSGRQIVAHLASALDTDPLPPVVTSSRSRLRAADPVTNTTRVAADTAPLSLRVRWQAADMAPASTSGRICVEPDGHAQVCASYTVGQKPADALTRRLAAAGINVQSSG
jgi:hypothetical protein